MAWRTFFRGLPPPPAPKEWIPPASRTGVVPPPNAPMRWKTFDEWLRPDRGDVDLGALELVPHRRHRCVAHPRAGRPARPVEGDERAARGVRASTDSSHWHCGCPARTLRAPRGSRCMCPTRTRWSGGSPASRGRGRSSHPAACRSTRSTRRGLESSRSTRSPDRRDRRTRGFRGWGASRRACQVSARR